VQEAQGCRSHAGSLLLAIIHTANIQGRDGGVMLMKELFVAYPTLRTLYADGGYRGPGFLGK
jgi:hypothetical protein